MREKGKNRILIICPYPFDQAAGQRLKYEQYVETWEKDGYTVQISPFMNESLWQVVHKKGYLITKFFGVIRGYLLRIRDIFRIKNYEIVYIFQWTTPFGTKLYDFIIRTLAKKIIFDLEDFVILPRKEDTSLGSKNPNPLLKFFRSNSKTLFLIKKSDHVITSSPFLNDYCERENFKKNSTFISSSVNTDIFKPSNKYNNLAKVTIGWTGTFSSKPYLDLIKQVFINLSKECDFKLRIISNFEYEIPGVDYEVIRWSKEKEIEDLQGIDIGVYPLEDSQWVLGKSGLKAIQYMAFGIPTVASNVGTSPQIIEHLKNGWLVDSEEEWYKALFTLINNPNLRRSLGEKAREKILKNYSVHAIKSQYLEILNKQISDEG